MTWCTIMLVGAGAGFRGRRPVEACNRPMLARQRRVDARH